jgi:2-polyprenyl-3-methyl-5-hydroxy-6-metoxy-1,4-benzoquinol methylase
VHSPSDFAGAAAYPHSRFTGYDLREGALEEARTKAASLGLRNVRFVHQDLSALEEREAYDLVTAFDVIHDQAHPRTVLKNVGAVLKPGGTFLMVDIKALRCTRISIIPWGRSCVPSRPCTV